ncbi:hypothetical protein BO70DRAFT_276994, partial [Aspergillus heteromorphus CBS 117.55]
MGWWWNSSPKEGDSQASPSSGSSGSQPSPEISSSTPPQTQTPTPPLPPSSSPQPQPRTLSREEQADAEWNKLVASLESDVNGQRHQQSPSATDPSSPEPHASPSSIADDSLYPDTMSCRSAFDYAFFCQSFGGQFVNVYRYGELRSCSEHWDNFWTCMKTRNFGDQQRKNAIRDHYRKKAVKYKTGPSSEDVWDARTERVQNAFCGDFVALEKQMQAE